MVEQCLISNPKDRRNLVAQSLRLIGGLAYIESLRIHEEFTFRIYLQNIQLALYHVTTFLLSIPYPKHM